MRYITFDEYLAAAAVTKEQLKVRRQRGTSGSQIALAFGRGDNYGYEADRYIELDAVASRLADVLADKFHRNLAASIVRDQWGIWSRAVAVVEATKGQVFFYVIGYADEKGQRGYLTAGSKPDSRDRDNVQKIANDIYKRLKVIPSDYVVIEMWSVLANVRLNAEKAGYDFGAAFLPPLGDPRLDEVLKPYDDSVHDRDIVVNDKAIKKRADLAGSAGKKARSAFEAMLPRSRLLGRTLARLKG